MPRHFLPENRSRFFFKNPAGGCKTACQKPKIEKSSKINDLQFCASQYCLKALTEAGFRFLYR